MRDAPAPEPHFAEFEQQPQVQMSAPGSPNATAAAPFAGNPAKDRQGRRHGYMAAALVLAIVAAAAAAVVSYDSLRTVAADGTWPCRCEPVRTDQEVLQMARKQIVILVRGAGGTMTANRLCSRFDHDEAEIHVVDRDDRHVHQPGLGSLVMEQKMLRGIKRRAERLVAKGKEKTRV